MSVRNDVTVRWGLSPRLIEIDIPSTEITIQDLYDTCKFLEAQNAGMDDDPLIDSAGKENLGGGVSVGLTATLLNAQVYFPPRSTPLASGDTCTTADADGETLISTGSTFQTDLIKRGDVVFNNSTGGMATVLSVTSETELEHLPLTGGSRDDWQVGDAITLYENPQCNVQGGNLVAVDDVGGDISAVLQSPLAQVVRTSSSSATTQNQASLEYSTFDGAVHVDPASPYALLPGEDPLASLKGNPQYPVNNIPDAVVIDTARGLGKNMHINGAITLDTGDILDGFLVVGQNANRTSITINSGASMTNVEIQDAFVTGNLDGQCILRFCAIQNLNYVNGFIYTCIIQPGYIYLSGTSPAFIMDCKSGVPGLGTPVIAWITDENTPLAVRGYDGGFELQNKAGDGAVSADISAGQVKIKNTCTNGLVVVRGDTKVIDADTDEFMPSGTYNGNLQLVNEGTPGYMVQEINAIVKEIYERMGLDTNNPVLNRIDGSFQSTNINVTATEDGGGNITHQRI